MNDRYSRGEYKASFGDDDWKATKMAALLSIIPDFSIIKKYADIGCGEGGVLNALYSKLVEDKFSLEKVVGYDVCPISENILSTWDQKIEYRKKEFLKDDECFDLITLHDVIEHVLCPSKMLEDVAKRAKYVALHIPLDNRVSVMVADQYNFRIKEIGHISFYDVASALNLLTESGLQTIECRYTAGFLAPSGRIRFLQKIIMPMRYLVYRINPGLTAKIFGGVSLAVLCKGQSSG